MCQPRNGRGNCAFAIETGAGSRRPVSADCTERWSGAAERWAAHADEVDEEAAAVTEWLLAAAAPAPGEAVLELGAGPGGVGLAAARAVAPAGRVILTDVAPPMIEVARARARDLGLENVDFAVADATALAQPDASVDVVLCRFAYQAMDDPARAFAESLRVLRPGGRLAFAVFPAPERNPWASLSFQALAEAAGAPAPGSERPGMFALADEQHLRSLLTDAGFVGVRLEHVIDERRFDSFESWWLLRRELPPGARQTWSSLDAAAREDVERNLRKQVRRYSRDGELVFPADALVAFARRADQ